MITYDKAYYWLIRLRYFAYTVSPSHWTYPNSGRFSLACCSPEYLQHSFFVLICKMLHAVCDWFASQHWAGDLPRFRVPPAQYWIIRPDYKMEHSPHSLFALPAALSGWERTCHFKHCSYAIFTSNTDEIRGGSIVKTLQLYVIITSGEHFVTDWYTC